MFSLWTMMQSYSRTSGAALRIFNCFKRRVEGHDCSGTLLRQENQRYSFSAGEWWEKGKTTPNQYYNFDLTYYESGVDHFVLEAANEHKLYSGWWCCCYSLNVVREDNLPFQFFVHHDDIEYGIRNRDVGITFLNGICVWHRDVRGAMPGIMSYYDMRNFLIEWYYRRIHCS